MGETADQTRQELDDLRADLTREAAEVRSAAERTARSAVPPAIGIAAAGVVLGGLVLLVRRRRRTRRPPVAAPAGFVAQPPRRGLGGKLLEVAVKAAVTTATATLVKTLVSPPRGNKPGR